MKMMNETIAGVSFVKAFDLERVKAFDLERKKCFRKSENTFGLQFRPDKREDDINLKSI